MFLIARGLRSHDLRYASASFLRRFEHQNTNYTYLGGHCRFAQQDYLNLSLYCYCKEPVGEFAHFFIFRSTLLFPFPNVSPGVQFPSANFAFSLFAAPILSLCVCSKIPGSGYLPALYYLSSLLLSLRYPFSIAVWRGRGRRYREKTFSLSQIF